MPLLVNDFFCERVSKIFPSVLAQKITSVSDTQPTFLRYAYAA